MLHQFQWHSLSFKPWLFTCGWEDGFNLFKGKNWVSVLSVKHVSGQASISVTLYQTTACSIIFPPQVLCVQSYFHHGSYVFSHISTTRSSQNLPSLTWSHPQGSHSWKWDVFHQKRLAKLCTVNGNLDQCKLSPQNQH